MALTIKDLHVEVVTTTYFKIAGLPILWRFPEETAELTKEIDDYLKSIGADKFWLSNDDIQINFEHDKCSTSPEDIMAAINSILERHPVKAAQ